MEAAKFPEFGERFYEPGPKRGEERLAAVLRSHFSGQSLVVERFGELRAQDSSELSLPRVQLVECLLQLFQLLPGFTEFAFRG
jgi:hypothetical protein